MRVVVCIKQVPATDEVRIDPQTKTLIREGVPMTINPLDDYALETALRIKDAVGAEIIAISMGPPSAEQVLRHALGMGCDEAVLLSDRAMAGADTLATARVLAAAVRKVGDVDLVVCGDHSSDGDTGSVGPQVAELLGLPQVTFALSAQVEDGVLRVRRLLPGVIETVEVPLPALITVLKSPERVRRPNLLRLRRAQERQISVWGVQELGLDRHEVGMYGSPTKVLDLFTPPPRPGAQKFVVSPGEAAARIAAIVCGEADA
ncbi:MAG: electron transfer flavoprotein subunit beta/FixA family protein [Armatimonadetes bacterium]|nr:electron transfer flavoprotein subunit beta/FixA family protein [Armatimonadota bacterium]